MPEKLTPAQIKEIEKIIGTKTFILFAFKKDDCYTLIRKIGVEHSLYTIRELSDGFLDGLNGIEEPKVAKKKVSKKKTK